MNDKNFKQFIQEAKKINLKGAEKAAIKQSVLNFIASNPIRPGVEPRLVNNESMVPILSKSLIWLQYRGSAISLRLIGTMVLVLSVLVSGGVAMGAEKALPGDILYPVKIGINEEVRGWLATSEESKTDWEIKKAERRLEEAETLAAEGSLDADKTAKIEASFEANAIKVRESVQKFNNKEDFNAAASVSLNFEKALNVHEKILSRLAEKRGEVETQIRPIRARVDAEVNNSSENRREMKVRIKAKEDASVEAGDKEDKHDKRSNIKEDSNNNTDSHSEDGSVNGATRLKINLGF